MNASEIKDILKIYLNILSEMAEPGFTYLVYERIFDCREQCESP